MEIYSFTNDRLKRQYQYDGNTYDLFFPTLIDKKLQNLTLYTFVIPESCAGRMDKVSILLYGQNKYTDELLKLNNIYNPFSIKAGDVIVCLPQQDLVSLYNDEILKGVDVMKINNPKNNTSDGDRVNNLPPVIKNKEVKQLLWNKDNKSVTINNKTS